MDMDNNTIAEEMSNHNNKRKHNTTTDLPQKKYFRQRAHSNPMADHDFNYPIKPELMDWSTLYPEYHERTEKKVEFADLGCGYGGLLVTLSPMFPETLILGLEIRVKVSDYVINRIKALRENTPGQYNNIACVRTNAMKYLPNFFNKGQLKKMFFLYPDPHFKKCKYKWRIINDTLLAEYAYLLSEEGMLYTVTDVYDLHEWIVTCISRHALFKRIPDHMLLNDKICDVMLECSEEGQKVTRNNGQKYIAVFTRISDPIERYMNE